MLPLYALSKCAHFRTSMTVTFDDTFASLRDTA